MTRPALRKNGKPYTDSERARRYRIRKKARIKGDREAARQARCAVVATELGIHAIAVADITEDHLASDTVAAVVTDPPYGRTTLGVYADLGRFAMRVLKPSGWCIVLTGTMYLPEVLAALLATGLRYRWQIAATFPGGGHAMIHAMHVNQAYKPVLVLQKEPVTPLPVWQPDVIAAPVTDQSKDLHRWQQSATLFETLVERFSMPGDLVADPFAGSGTTLRAALSLGRHAWGADNGSADHLRPLGSERPLKSVIVTSDVT